MFDCKSERKSIGKREREGRDKRRRERVERIHGGKVIENQSFILPVVTVESTVTRSFVFSRSFLNIPWYFAEFLVKERWSMEDNRGFRELIVFFNFPLNIECRESVGWLEFKRIGISFSKRDHSN